MGTDLNATLEAIASVSIVVPTYNERDNIEIAVGAIRTALGNTRQCEIIVVDDDSPDGTWQVVDTLAQQDSRIRCHRRIDRKGLASAIIDGLSLARGDYLAVMDADMQHDPALLPSLFSLLQDHDLVVASRYMSGGSTGNWNRTRLWGSRAVTSLCRQVLRIKASDPMSGYFALRKTLFHEVAPRLRPKGFKALLDILANAPKARIAEVPLRFGTRASGTSKLGASTVIDLIYSVIELRTGHAISVRFLQYGLVGLSGVAIQLGTYEIYQIWLGEELALLLAICTAMLSNFLINNLWTFRDRFLQLHQQAAGFLRFCAVSSIGAAINHSLTIRAHQLTGLNMLLCSLVGISIATVWNYQLNRGITWKLWDKSE